jgi:uncharacterized protein YgiM (DUF1202 family)
METLGYWASDSNPSPPDLLIPDLNSSLSVFGLMSSLILTSWGTQIPVAAAALSRGDRCNSVTDLQNALLAAGFDPGAVDGVFGGATEYAVLRFQEENELVSDRIVGQATATALGLNPAVACAPATTAVEPTASPQNTAQATAGTTATSPSEAEENVAVVSIPVRIGQVSTEGGVLNIRSGLSVDYGVVNTVQNGTIVRFVGQPVDAWLQLLDGGWIHSDWVTFVSAEETSKSTEPKAAETVNSTQEDKTVEAKGGPATPISPDAIVLQKVEVQTGGSPLNVRKAASYEAEITGQLDDKQQVTALVPAGEDTLPQWVQLTSGGWVDSSWLVVKDSIQPQG